MASLYLTPVTMPGNIAGERARAPGAGGGASSLIFFDDDMAPAGRDARRACRLNEATEATCVAARRAAMKRIRKVARDAREDFAAIASEIFWYLSL